jgi:hypothetical protein
LLLACASFTVGQVQQVIRHGDQLVLLRAVTSNTGTTTTTSQVLVYDFSDPTAPTAASALDLPADFSPYYSYYRYYCGDVGYWGGYYFGYGQTLASILRRPGTIRRRM